EKDVPGLGRRGAATKMSGRAPLLGVEPSGLSKDRRRFIIISIFDATLTTLLWLLCTILQYFSTHFNATAAVLTLHFDSISNVGPEDSSSGELSTSKTRTVKITVITVLYSVT
ncbi:hypothetical protein ANCDUO_20328, partial [Ancylostoma duodenale]